MHLFYTPKISAHTHVLDEQESKHAIRVLRLKRGDEVILIDGHGGWYKARIEEDHHKACLLSITSKKENFKPLPYNLHIAISPTKNMDRFEWFLEKATEIGISRITPLICTRSERTKVKMDRLDRILVSAMKQSLKAYKPELSDPVKMENFINQSHNGTLAIAHCHAHERLSVRDLDSSDQYTILIGPEGDFTNEELQAALGAGYKPLHLGASRLRTETAGVHVCSVISILQSGTLPYSFE